MMSSAVGWTTIAVLALGTAACAVPPARVPLDPSANFAAHDDHRGIVVDRMEHGERAALVASATLFSRGAPLLIEEGDTAVAALWPDGTGYVVRAADGDGATLGDVRADWTDGAIRLTLHPRDGASYRTSAFRRVGGRRAPALLGQPAANVLDVRGVYVAEVRNAAGEAVGWLRVDVSRYGPAPRVYDGSLPPSINGPLAVAAVQRLDAAINRVERHAVNPYLGN